METQTPVERPTVRAHKRQFAWQILVPFLVMAALIVAGATLVVTGGTSRTGVWADVSLVWLIAPALLIALMVLAILAATIYGMFKLLQVLPRYTGKTQDIFAMLSAGTRKVADGAARPIVWVREAGAAIKSIFKF
jgi:hypothetical protein